MFLSLVSQGLKMLDMPRSARLECAIWTLLYMYSAIVGIQLVEPVLAL